MNSFISIAKTQKFPKSFLAIIMFIITKDSFYDDKKNSGLYVVCCNTYVNLLILKNLLSRFVNAFRRCLRSSEKHYGFL